MTLSVEESFGNCPKYVFPRQTFTPRDPAAAWAEPQDLGVEHLDAEARAMIARADVFFIASHGPDDVDISHRGGLPGFVEMTLNGALQIADYRGNHYFNTFGNFLLDPAAALLFVDFALGAALHLSGTTRIEFSGEQGVMTFEPTAARMLRAVEVFGTASLAPAPEAPSLGSAGRDQIKLNTKLRADRRA